MYERFFGFSGLPFSLLPDADFLYPSKRHRRAVNLLEYGMLSHAGFIAITGEVGAGKTTIIRRFIKSAGKDIVIGVINNPSVSFGHLLSWIAMSFSLEQTGKDQPAIYNAFIEFLVAQYAKGKRTVLIIDEAQNLNAAMLEELRMLSNVNNEKDQLLQVVLVGQPELLEMLNRPELKQFAQRISVHCHLDTLAPAETAAYIRHRLGLVGGEPQMFDNTACATVHFYTGGVPRLINLLCDQALVYAFSEEKAYVDSETVAEVVQDRARSGLTAFRVLPEGWNISQLQNELKAILHEIQSQSQKEGQ